MPIPNSGQISLNDDVNATLTGSTNEQNVSLELNNVKKFATPADGDTVSGRSMSELRGQTLFQINPTTEETGWLGDSLHMDGVTSSHNSVKVLEPGSTTAPAFTNTKGTFSFWIKIHKATSDKRYLYTSGTSSSNSLVSILLHSSGTNHKLYVRIDGVYFTSQATFIDKAGWYNFVVSLDSSILTDGEKIKAYANGIRLTWESVGNLTDNQAFQFGTNQRINDWAFGDGYGADATYGNFIFVDGSALLPNEFGELSYGIWVPKTVNKQSSDTLITTNLIANYQLENNANDTSIGGTTYNGTSNNVTFQQNNYNIASFNGTSSYIDLPSTIDDPIRTASAFTVSVWFRRDGNQVNNYGGRLVHLLDNLYININIETNNTVKALVVQPGSVYPETQTLVVADKVWNHLVFTGDSNGIRLYLNSTLVDSDNWSGAFMEYTNTDYKFNRLGYTGSGVAYLKGQIGEVQIYTSAFTDANVLQNYNATKHKYFYGLNGWHFNFNNTDTGSVITPGSNLKIHLDAGDWDADGTDETSFSGTTWSDKSGNSTNGTISGATYSTDNGGCFDFDGSNDRVNFGNLTLFNSGDYTAEFWMNNEGGGDYQYMANQRYDGDSGSPINVSMYGPSASNPGDIYCSCGSSWFRTDSNLSINTWYHVVFTVIAGGAMKVYVNGVEQPVAAGTASETTTRPTPTNLNFALGMNANTQSGVSDYPFNGKIAQFKAYNKALTAQEVIQNFRATQGHYGVLSLADISGNAKGGIANGTNLTGTDHVKDKSDVNYATLSEEDKSTSVTLSDGGHVLTNSASGWKGGIATMGVSSGKWYYEVKFTATNTRGIYDSNSAYFIFGWQKAEAVGAWESTGVAGDGSSLIMVTDTGCFGISSSQNTGGSNMYGTTQINSNAAFAVNDVIGVALNADTGSVQIYKNGSTLGSAVTFAASTYVPVYSKWSSTHGNGTFNFGAKGFAHTPPSGYLALSSNNIPTATNVDPVNKKKPSDYFSTVLYQGDGKDSKSITGVGFAPDFVWTKKRSGSADPLLQNTVNGAGTGSALYSNKTGTAGSTDHYGYISSFDTDGFTHQAGSHGSYPNDLNNESGSKYVSWNWKAGGKPTATNAASAGAAPTSGSVMIDGVASTANLAGGVPAKKISANTSAGFSIVQYTGQSSGTQTVAHGLTKAPRMIIQKQTNGTGDWYTYFPPGVVDSSYNYLVLNTTGLGGTTSSTAPTTTTFNPVSTQDDFIAYCFHDIDGYQKIGTYSSNNSSNGPFVYLGFKPAWLMFKKVSGTAGTGDSDSWFICDGTRDTENTIGKLLVSNGSEGEGDIKGDDVYPMTFTSNGFKVTGDGEGQNLNATYIYYAIAEDSAKYSQGFGQGEGTVEKFLEKGTGSTEYPAEHFQTVTYTGTSAARKINLNFSPDLVWTKARNESNYSHFITDSIRGGTKVLQSNATSAEAPRADNIQSFDNDGFTLGADGTSNYNNTTYAAWNWKAGDTTVTKKPTYTSSGILTSNLALHYNFADSNTYSGSGTTVYDLTSNDNDGTLLSSPTWVDRAYGNYFDFDGSNDQIDTNYQLPADSTMSFEWWMNADTPSANKYICNDGNGTGHDGSLAIYHTASGQLGFWVGANGAGGSYTYGVHTIPGGCHGKWMHFVVVLTASGVFIYKNGINVGEILQSSGASIGPHSTAGVLDLFIGSLGSYNSNYLFDGKIGQFRIYTAELTQSQIRANYDATRTLYQGVGTTGNVLQTGLLNNIDVDSFSSYDPNSFGSTNKVASFNGSSSLIEASDPNAAGGARTFSAWIKTTSTAFQSIITNGGTSTASGLNMFVFNNKLYSTSGNGTSGENYGPTGSSDINTGKWVHCVLTLSGTASGAGNSIKAYVNGTLEDTFSVGVTITDTYNDFRVGGRTLSGSNSTFFDGEIDQVRIFSKALSATEVATLYNETSSTTGTLNPTGISNCIVLYNFNSDSGTAVDDVSTNYDGTASSVTFAFDNTTSHRIKDQTSNNLSLGSLVNTTINESNSWGTSLKYDGAGDYVTLPIGLGRTATQDVTREFWIKVDDYPSSGNIDYFFYIGDMSSSAHYETIAVQSDGTLKYQERPTNSSGGSDLTLSTPSSAGSLKEGIWHHVVYTSEGRFKKIYLDGKCIGTATASNDRPNNSTYAGSLGSFRGSESATFQGEIAQFRSYTSVLTETQVKANYDATKPQFHSALLHSSVSVNEKAGFSIVKWTGDGDATKTVAHGLSAAPSVIILKDMDNVRSWQVYHSSAGASYKPYGGNLERNAAFNTSSGTNGSLGTPTSSAITFTNGSSTINNCNASGANIVAYCWREISGYSKFGTYISTGATGSNNIITTGFQPEFLLVKSTEDAEDWYIFDSKRINISGSNDGLLFANTNASENTGYDRVTFTSTGFYWNTAYGGNSDGYTYIYMAFA